MGTTNPGQSTSSARVGTGWATALLLLTFIVVLAASFARNGTCLLVGLDGTSWRVMLDAQAADRTPFSQEGVDPYEGSFDAYYPVFREYLLPSAIALMVTNAMPSKVATYATYAAFLLFAAYAFARTVGFDRPTALLGSFFLPLVSFPAIVGGNGLFYALYSLNPHISQIAGLSLLIVAAFWALDMRSRVARLLLIPVPALCLVAAILALVPYVSLMVPATALYGGAAFFAAPRWRDNLPRVIAGLLMIAIPASLGMVTYVRALVGYTAYQFFAGEFLQGRSNLVYASTVFWPGSPLGKIAIALVSPARAG